MNIESRYQPPGAVVADIPQEELLDGRLNPWFSIWTRPRATIQQIVAIDSNRLIILLAILIGITQTLDRASTRSVGDRLSLGAILAMAFVLGPIVGIISIHVYAWLVHWTGRALAGSSSLANIRAAIVWGNVPALWTALSWIPAIAVLQLEMFTTETPRVDSSVPHLMVLFGVGIAQLVGGIWSIVAVCKALGQVQGFSAWKALGNAVLAALVVVVPVGLIALAMILTLR